MASDFKISDQGIHREKVESEILNYGLLKSLIINNSSLESFNFISENVDLNSSQTTVVNTTHIFNISKDEIKNEIVNLHRINDIRYINKFFEAINERLPFSGKFICCVETFSARKKRKTIFNSVPFLNSLFFLFEFLFLRIVPKIKFLKNIYFSVTKGRNRVFSKAESLGRLVSCGFKIIKFKEINGLLYIVTSKNTEPSYDMNPSYGPIYRMPRVGKDGKIIRVYKLRTMHPYSEYLQNFMFENYGSKNGDKINDDFRVSPIGRVLRALWIDEIPMVINLMKGELKLVGVRPLSISKFNMYPKTAQNERIKFKPGLIPPFYADLPRSFSELIDSEMRYLQAYEKNGFRADLDYFIKAFNNIIVKGARSF